MSACDLPQDLIFEILSRLPVKSLVHLKSVSKPWLALIKNPNFISLHLNRTAMNPNNDAVIIYSLSLSQHHIMSLLYVNSIDNKPINLDHPLPQIFPRMDLVGSYNGIVCLSCPPNGRLITLLNPATRQYKVIQLSSTSYNLDDVYSVSVGFGFDPVANDYKIVVILHMNLELPREKIRVKVEVYSAKNDSWKMIEVETPFFVSRTRCNAILKGSPYWTGFIRDEEEVSGIREVFVLFDPQNEVFGLCPVPEYPEQVS
ncbi:unnamed protein product [Ilex paraguariensis]|uniref:F-box domain-containing protein n=1 Tax=Ilex paraguariensis TaxID=185542 RepID=A0ABC8SRD0_9AQUA